MHDVCVPAVPAQPACALMHSGLGRNCRKMLERSELAGWLLFTTCLTRFHSLLRRAPRLFEPLTLNCGIFARDVNHVMKNAHQRTRLQNSLLIVLFKCKIDCLKSQFCEKLRRSKNVFTPSRLLKKSCPNKFLIFYN